MDLATHDIDVTQWVTGSHYRTVSAFAGRPSGRPYEDLVAVSGVLFDGTVTSHLVNWLSPMKERVIAVTGQRGCLVADTLATELWYHRNGSVTVADPHDPPFHGASEGDLIRYAVGKREALVTELENFRDAVLGKPADVVTMGQGVETIEVATAVLAASRDGSAVGLAASGIRLADGPAPALGSRARVAR
jgi:predicted dehydrogenase